MNRDFQNIPELLRARIAAAPDKVFLFSQPDGRQYTYKQFGEAVQRTASLLTEKGIKKGDVVSLLMPNGVEFIVAYFACWQLGALAGPINSLLKAQEVAYVISDSEAKALLVNSQFLSTIDPVKQELEHLSNIILFDSEAEATRNLLLRDLEPALIGPDDEAIIIYTSGTTGKPKGCLLTHRNVLSNARQISQWLGFGPADRLLTVMPLFHMNAVS